MSECTHYDCGVDIQAFCCKEFFSCRICHDRIQNEEEKDPKKRHTLNRYETQIVKCRQCLTEQPPQQNCISCGVCFGVYFCSICRLYENTPGKNIYHCPQCTICRIGPEDKYFHCNNCGTCLSITLKDSHSCMVDATKRDCAICQENLFYSRAASIIMKCGHFIHLDCQNDMIKNHHYTCPICLKYIIDAEELTKLIDQEVTNTPMPEEYKTMEVKILCNECGAKSQVLFHVLGLKCPECGKYNTSRS